MRRTFALAMLVTLAAACWPRSYEIRPPIQGVVRDGEMPVEAVTVITCTTTEDDGKTLDPCPRRSDVVTTHGGRFALEPLREPGGAVMNARPPYTRTSVHVCLPDGRGATADVNGHAGRRDPHELDLVVRAEASNVCPPAPRAK